MTIPVELRVQIQAIQNQIDNLAPTSTAEDIHMLAKAIEAIHEQTSVFDILEFSEEQQSIIQGIVDGSTAANDLANQLAAIQAEGTTQVNNVQTEGTTQVNNIQAEGTTQVNNVQTEGTTHIAALQTLVDNATPFVPNDVTTALEVPTNSSIVVVGDLILSNDVTLNGNIAII